MARALIIALSGAFIVLYPLEAPADYALVLKNGRRIAVESYREEAGNIKFYGFGGEIGIPKEQIESIEKTAARRPEPAAPAQTVPEPRSEPRPPAPVGAARQPARAPTPEEERAKQEKEYQQKLADLTAQLGAVKDRYSQSTRGTTSRDPTLLTSEEEIKRLNEDAAARLKDAQSAPVDPGVVKLATPSPFTTLGNTTTELRPPQPAAAAGASPSPAYTEREKELSDLRNQAIRLEQARENLINEMRQKGLATGALFDD